MIMWFEVDGASVYIRFLSIFHELCNFIFFIL